MEVDGSPRVAQMQVLGCEGWMKPDEHRGLLRKWVIWTTLTQLVVVGGTYLMAPGYMIPFLNHPIARLVFVATCVWDMAGWVLLYALPIKTRFTFDLTAMAVVVVFCLPLLLVPMIGPAVIGIMQAIGPVMYGTP